MGSPRETSAGALSALVDRLQDLALVDLRVLLRNLDAERERALVAAYVSDLEDALAEARAHLREGQRELGAASDPLNLLDLASERRAGNAAAVTEASARLARRASARRDLARLEELVRGVLPRLLEADRRLAGS
jgi:hypothetical protein